MKLYIVREIDDANNFRIFFYWAENEGDAIAQHREQVQNPDVELVAAPVFANNSDLRCRGFVVTDL